MAQVMPARVDLRPGLTPIRDQGERETCLAFAVTAAHEVARSAGQGVVEDLAEEVLYWGCKQEDGDGDPGTSFVSAATALARWGQPQEALWPYDPGHDAAAADYTPPAAALDPAVCRRARLQPVGATVGAIKACLVAGEAVALGIRIAYSFLTAPGGHIPVPAVGEPLVDAHAVLVAGYDDGEQGRDGFFIVRNSWGTAWGDQGYGYLPYRYLETHGGEAWQVIIPA